MNRFFTLLLAASCSTSVGQEVVVQPNESSVFFDGTGDYVLIPESPGFESENHTIMLWFFSDHVKFGDCISKDGGGGERQWLFETRASKKVMFHVWTDQGIAIAETEVALEDNRWYHLAQRWDGQSLDFFIDGVLVASRAHSGQLTSGNSPVRIGGGAITPDQNGHEDEVQIWSRALSANEINGYMMCRPAPGTDNLEGLWTFESVVDGVVFDLSGNERHGTIQGNAVASNLVPTLDCEEGIAGCTDSNACNYNTEVEIDDGSCLYIDECGECGGEGVAACTDSSACNFNSGASCDDGSCLYLPAIDLGDDIETCEESVTLNAGAGYDSYLWSTGDTTQNVEVSEAGQYSVQVESGVSGNLYSADFGLQANCGFGNTWVDCGQVFESNESFSVGGWLFNNGCDYTTIVSQRPGGSCTDPYYGPGPYNGFHLSYENDGQFEFRLHQNSNGNDAIESAVTTPAIEEAWVHLVGVFESGQSVKLFLNGVLVDSQPTSIEALEFCDYPFLIGSLQHGGNWSWDGKLDDIFAYGRALSDVEVLSVYESSFPSDGLSGLWQFEEGGGSVAYDSSGNGKHGAVTGAIWSTDVPDSAGNWTLHHVENFDGDIGSEWNTTESLTFGGNGVLGKFGENAQVLGTFSGLPTHTQIEVGFDLYVIDSWDGNYGGVDGPDQWFFEIDQQPLISTTFANNPNANNNGGQSYPADGTTTFNPIQTGASLLLPNAEGPDCCDCGYYTSVYHIDKIVNHNSDSVTLHFSDSLSQSICDESWAIDNVNIRYKNSPTCWLSDSISVDFLSPGCIDDYACNYDINAQCNDGSCDYSCCPGPGCCGVGTTWNWETSECDVANPADINLDGCVQLNDLLDLLSAYGDCGAEESAWQCGDPLEYQGYNYETVQIGEQCWFAENLRAQNYQDGAPISPEAFSAGALEFGLLYRGSVVADGQSVCPTNWSVSSDNDWLELEMFLGAQSSEALTFAYSNERLLDQGDALKLASENSVGFNATFGGYLNGAEATEVTGLGMNGQWWTSTASEENASLLIYRNVENSTSGISRIYKPVSAYGFSIRCIKDAE